MALMHHVVQLNCLRPKNHTFRLLVSFIWKLQSQAHFFSPVVIISLAHSCRACLPTAEAAKGRAATSRAEDPTAATSKEEKEKRQ